MDVRRTMKRLIPKTTLLIALLLVGFPAFAQEAEIPDFQGIWDTDMGTMALWQQNEYVWGLYGDEEEIGGYITENGVLNFKWDSSPDGMGTGWFRMNDDGTGFEGRFLNDIELSEQGDWDGELLGENSFNIGDPEALNYQPGDELFQPDEEPDTDLPDGIDETADVTDAETPEEPEDAEVPDETVDSTDGLSSWGGTWETARGYIVMAVSEDSIVGSFGEYGKLEATVQGTALSGTWSITDEEGNSLEGEMVYWLSEDGLSFRGTYNSSDEPDLWLVWSGTKVFQDGASGE